MIFIALFIWAAAAQTGLNVFNGIDNTFPDPCVKATGFTGDCNPSNELPWQSPTYLLPMNGASFQLAITGRFPVGAQFALSAATPASNRGKASSTCGALPLATAGVTGVINADQSIITLTVPVGWMSPAMEAETISRRLCWQPSASPTTAWAWTGFRVGVVYNCAAPGNSNCVRADKPTDPVLAAIQSARTFCCTSNGQTSVAVGQCINPNVESCCGAAAVAPGLKCCSTIRETVQWADAACPCVRSSSGTDCPSTDRCCLPSKYPELAASIDVGTCYNPNQQRCCNIGQAYDPGLLQCCALTGLQSPLVPCPCANDNDCLGGQTGQILTDQKCCRQVVPSTNFVDTRCTKYTNYPGGQGGFVTQQCPGTCIDTRYQICCNGARCIRQYEKCCNSTCCNMFNGTCSTQYDRAPSKANWVNVHIPNKVCTIVEQLNPVNVFWVFILPTALLAATLSGLALALVFASKVEHKARRALEKMMILAALVAILCGIPTFFSPAYKYGSVVLVISLFAIVSASARKIRVYVVAIVLHIILVLYLWDPFHGNDYLTLASDRTPFGRPDPRTAGLLHTVSRMHDSSMGNGHTSEPTALTTIPGSPQEVMWMEEACYRFYDYFKLDPYLRDTIRFDDPNVMFFGFCSRGWVIAILIAQGFVMIAVAAQVILHLIALMIRGGLLRGDHYYSGGVEEFDDASSHSS